MKLLFLKICSKQYIKSPFIKNVFRLEKINILVKPIDSSLHSESKKNKEVLNNTTVVTFQNCTTTRCALKRNSTMHIEIKFKLEMDVKDLITEVYGEALNIPIPLLGIDNKNICNNIYEEDGIKTKCPLLKGRTYIYKEDIYIIKAYPKFKVDVHWSLQDPNSRTIITCFEAPAKIID